MQGDETVYNNCVAAEYQDSCDSALREEIGITFMSDQDAEAGIDIMTDARHGWRKNSQHTDVVCIGINSHQVLRDEIVTKEEDSVSQRHERLGTERIYTYLETHPDGPVSVRVHAHDRNMSINKYIRTHQHLTLNQNDTWHALKAVERELKKLSSGSQHRHGVTWHEELSDKISSIRTHINYALRNSEGDEIKFKSSVDNIVNHYKNVHDRCNPTSRCRREKNYEPSKIIITDPKAEKLLAVALQNSLIYKHPKDSLSAMETAYVESFNNVMNVFHHKRVSFGKSEYFRRSHLAVLHWNENVDRDSTSEWVPPARRLAPELCGHRNAPGKKRLVKPSYNYQNAIWSHFMRKLYP